jgi:hypothetical protein
MAHFSTGTRRVPFNLPMPVILVDVARKRSQTKLTAPLPGATFEPPRRVAGDSSFGSRISAPNWLQ